jgi:manganese/zinc/iron transport system substrate-binding protein
MRKESDRMRRAALRTALRTVLRSVLGIAAALLLMAAFSCGRQDAADKAATAPEAPGSAKIKSGVINAVATTGMVADLVKNIGGDRVNVTALMGAGVDPHLYKAGEGDVARMSGADIIFYNGLHLEGKMSEVLEKISGKVKTAAVADGIDRQLLLSPPAFQGNFDPHIWFNVEFWMKAAEHTRNVLKEFDPEYAQTYSKNCESYLARLHALNEYLKERSAMVSADKRVLITAHDAFNYFGRAYGFEVRGLQGVSTVAEAGAADVQALAAFIVKRKIPAIFIETSVPTRYVDALKAAVDAKGFQVKIGGSLYSDALGSPGTPEATYVGMVRKNIDTIVGALMGDNTDGGRR